MSTMDAINSNEDKYMIKVSEDDAINAKFNTKLQELLDIAHSKKNVIEDTELIKHFNDLKEVALDLDTMQKIFNFLEKNGVDILQITDDKIPRSWPLADDDEKQVEQDVQHARKRQVGQRLFCLADSAEHCVAEVVER